jgi:ubiquinone/menaquinone biosynthesis C-methylase UbiE
MCVPNISPFENNTERYEMWFERHNAAYNAEIRAIRRLIPDRGSGLEIGVGTGRFAIPFNIKTGVEPSKSMAEIARKRKINVVEAVAEKLPFEDSSFDFALMVTSICFVDDIELSFKEAYRVLKDRGSLIVGFVDRNSPLGRIYEKNREKSVFYRSAKFYSSDEVITYLKKAGFKSFTCVQTIFHHLDEVRDNEEIKEGCGEGSFVVIRAMKQ